MTDQQHILRSPADLTHADICHIYDNFDAPIAALDCGQKCAPHNGGIPFCCDIRHAVPAAYTSEWEYLQVSTNLWHPYDGADQEALSAETPESMTLLACLGHTRCQRNFRALSCRQFPFFPYITSDYRFIGLAYDWAFENRCWVISNLDQVNEAYRQQFVATFDFIFANFDDEFEAYAKKSAEARAFFAVNKRRVPILSRNEGAYLLSPGSERPRRVDPSHLPRFHPYD